MPKVVRTSNNYYGHVSVDSLEAGCKSTSNCRITVELCSMYRVIISSNCVVCRCIHIHNPLNGLLFLLVNGYPGLHVVFIDFCPLAVRSLNYRFWWLSSIFCTGVAQSQVDLFIVWSSAVSWDNDVHLAVDIIKYWPGDLHVQLKLRGLRIPSLLLVISEREYQSGPMAEYERRIASGDLKPGDEFQVHP